MKDRESLWTVRALDRAGTEVSRTDIVLESGGPASAALERFRAFVDQAGGDLQRSALAALEDQRALAEAIMAAMSQRLSGDQAKQLARELHRVQSLSKLLREIAH